MKASPRAVRASSAASETDSIQRAASVATPLCDDEALEPLALARRDDARASGVDDRDELARDDPERPPHPEHADEAPILVDDTFEVGDLEAA